MTDKFANLAGYHGEETTFDATAFRNSIDSNGVGGLSQLDESDESDGSVVVAQPLQQRAVNARADSRSNTPVNRIIKESIDDAAGKTPRRSEKSATGTSTSSTSRKSDTRRQAIAAVIADGSGEVSDSFEDSEMELQRARRDLSTGQDTTAGDDSLANDESGITGARHVIGHRTAAGISMKDSEARIKKLEAENNELRIECDLWRQQMKPDEARLKVVTISKELARNRKSNVDLMRLLKEQDSSIKESKRILKKWGNLDPKEEQRKRREVEEALHQAQEKAATERDARLKVEKELEIMHQSGGEKASQLKQLLEEEREDHADAVYAIEKERDALQAQLDEALEASQSAADNHDEDLRQLEEECVELEQHLKSKEAENSDLLSKLDDLEEALAAQESEMEKLRSELAESQSAEETFSRELEVANRRLEHLSSDQKDEILRIREAEDAVADRLGAQIDQLRDEMAEVKLELQNKMEYIESLEAQRDDDDVKFQEMELELERATRALEEKVDEINALNEELDELDMLCQRAKQDAQEADEEAKKLSDVVQLKEEDIIETNKELQKISQALFRAEEDNEAIKREANALGEEMQELSSQLEDARERSERKEKAYKDRVVFTQAELDTVKSTNTELQAQLSTLEIQSHSSSPEESNKLITLMNRANNAERRLAAVQAQALQAEDRLNEAKSKYGEGENKWAARIKELESRNRAAEERVKRERQGAKERVTELVEQVRRLERELDRAAKRNKLLDDVRAAAAS